MRFPHFCSFAALSTLTVALSASPATAAIHAGNPVLELKLTVPGETLSTATADVDDLVMIGCDNTETVVATNATMDLEAGFDQAIPAGDWCAVRLEGLAWQQATGSGQSGNWAIDVTHVDLTIDIDPGDGTFTLYQYTVAQGAIHAGNPVLDIFID